MLGVRRLATDLLPLEREAALASRASCTPWRGSIAADPRPTNVQATFQLRIPEVTQEKQVFSIFIRVANCYLLATGAPMNCNVHATDARLNRHVHVTA
jgi:hypothetical protein